MDVAITRGRDLEASDTIDAAKVVVVNEAFVREFLPDVNPLGLSFKVWNAEWVIVGVCQNIKYNNIKEAVRPVHEALDHRHLNEVEGLENPTSENIAVWIWTRIAPALPALSEVRIAETCNNACVYRGPGG